MEDNRTVKFIIMLVGGTLLVSPLFVFGYDDKTTHPALTQETIKFFNFSFPENKISNKDSELAIQGSIDEDADIRWLNHFYDPVHNRGFNVAGKEWMSSKEWAQNTKAQTGVLDSAFAGTLKSYFSGEDDYSWDRAIYEYAWGDKKRGLGALGHMLHLLQDATVPDHTRNDPHPPILHLGSPYESWTKKFNPSTINISINEKPILFPNLGNYFDKTAIYSNNNFFSKDTILISDYSNPTILEEKTELLSDEVSYRFGFKKDENGSSYKLIRIGREVGKTTKVYSLKDVDNKILTDYWSHLSKQAVLHGAGVIKLFFDEVEKEKQTKILYNKNRSWLGKQIDKFQGGTFKFASALYGSSVKIGDLDETKPETIDVSPPDRKKISTELTPPKPSPTKISQPRTATIASAIKISPRDSSAAISANQNDKIITPKPKPPSSSNTSNNLPIAGVGGTSPPAEPPAPPPSPSPPNPPSDTTLPDISLTINECGQSLSTDGCLIATTTVTLKWLSAAEDLDYYEITINGIANATTSTSTVITVSDNTSQIFSAKSKDKTGNWSQSESKNVEIATHPVVINEIAWMGTSALRAQDEWIELYNPTEKNITLTNWVLRSATDNSPYIQLSGAISAKGFFLLERTDDTTISDISANQIYTGALVNSGEVLELSRASTTLDKTPAVNDCSGWCGGDSGAYYTMERYDHLASGESTNNWGTWAGFLANGKNADNAVINGTPGKRNSINYLIDKSITSLSQNKTLKKYASPYLITSSGFTVASAATLTLEPGVVIKLMSGGHLNVQGALKAEGTAADNIIFTSFKDDAFSGDTNADATSTTAIAGDWASLKILANGSSLDYVTIRYGGTEDLSGSYWANLRVENSSVTIKNSTIEKSKTYGIWLKNSSGAIDSNIIKNNDRNINGQTPGTGLVLSSESSPAITNNQFIQNTKGILIDTNSAPSLTNNSFTQNIKEAIQVVNGYPTFSGNSASSNGTNGIRIEGYIAQDYNFYANLPYVISTIYTVPVGQKLTLASGSVIKLSSGGSILVKGQLLANGTASSKIIFTSLKDDEYGGDTDAASSTPLAGDWLNLTFSQNQATSTLDNTIVRYGGDKNPFNLDKGAILIKNSSVEIKNSTIEKNYLIGVWMQNSTSTVISDSLIQNHTDATSETFYGAYLTSSSTPLIKNTKFKNNETHIFKDSTSSYTDGGGIIFE